MHIGMIVSMMATWNGRRLAARTNKLLRTMYRAHLRTCARPALA